MSLLSASEGAPGQHGGLRKVLLVLTSQCNLRCGYCFQNAKRPGAMSWGVARRALDLALGSEREDVEVSFYGGEPLLEFESIRRAVAYVEERRRVGQRVRFSVSSNGLLFSEEILEFLGRHSIKVRWSFDGVPAAQEARGHRTFATLDAWLVRIVSERAFREVARSLQIALTLVPRNVASLADSVTYFLGRGLREIAITPAVTPEPGWRVERIDELDAQFDRILAMSVAHWKRTWEVPVLVFRESPTRRADPETGGIPMCGAARGESLSVDLDGQVHGCTLFAESTQRFRTDALARGAGELRLGDVRAPDLDRRRATFPQVAASIGMFSGKERKHSSYGSCRECPHLDSCSICPVSTVNRPGEQDPDRVPDFPCACNKVALRHRDLFQARVAGTAAEIAASFREAAVPPAMVRLREAAVTLRAAR